MCTNLACVPETGFDTVHGEDTESGMRMCTLRFVRLCAFVCKESSGFGEDNRRVGVCVGRDCLKKIKILEMCVCEKDWSMDRRLRLVVCVYKVPLNYSNPVRCSSELSNLWKK